MKKPNKKTKAQTNKKPKSKLKPKSKKKLPPITIDIDPQKFIQVCQDRDAQVFDSFLSGIGTTPPVRGIPGDFMTAMAIQSLFRKEQEIVALENPKAHPDFKKMLDKTRQDYAQMRSNLRDKLGSTFDSLYAAQRKTDDECDIANHGCARPKFNEDGTHE